MKYIFSLICPLIYSLSMAQTSADRSNLPFRDITELPGEYTTENVVARMIDGLGFRFYWATEGLGAVDLAFRPTPESRTSEETIDHIMGLSTVILNCIINQPNIRSGEETSPLSFEKKRKITLNNLWQARQILFSQTVKAEYLNMIFVRNEGNQTIPLWNLINGPISDGLWYVGQVVTFRRSTGNPFNSKVSVLNGKLRE